MVGVTGGGTQCPRPNGPRPNGPRPNARADGLWSAEIRRDDEAFASLADDWAALYATCAAATPFQSHAWLESWWHEYGIPGRLWLVLVRRESRLVAAAPLMLERRGPWQVLSPLGCGLSDFTELLVHDGCAEDARRMLATALLAEPGWHIVDIREARPGGQAQHLYDAWPGARWHSTGSLCLEIAGRPLRDLLGQLPSRTAKKVRAKLRKIDACGISARPVGAAEVADAVPALLRLHERQWRGRGINEEHLRPRFERHLVRSVSRLVGQGQAALFQYRLDEQLVASELVLIGRDFVGTYLAGFDPDLRQEVDIATLLLSEDLALTDQLGRPTLSMLRGDEPYKMRWQPRRMRNGRPLLARAGRPRLAALYASAVIARAAAADAARERLPWLRRVRHRARQVVVRLAVMRE